ncbi:MAG: sulfatase [bacterium]|nr:sulfatase [bacterium]
MSPSSHVVFFGILLGLSIGCGEPPTERPNVVLVLVDTLRADHLGTYGYSKEISPAIDSFADGATLFDNAIAQAPHTIPSILQIMTSRHIQGKQLRPEDATLAETLRKAGYETTAIVENALFEFDREAHGLMRGFDTFYRNGVLDRSHIFQQHWKSKTPADVITAQARRWLRNRSSHKPFFLWLHYLDPHDPYMPPYADDMEELSWESGSEYTGDIRNTSLFPRSQAEASDFTDLDRLHLINLYDAEITYLDQSLGELFVFLDSEGLFDDSLVILSSDHGESLGEHGLWTHGLSLFEPEIHVPLIVKYPGQKRGLRVATPAQAIDIFPTIVDVTGIDQSIVHDGSSLRDGDAQAAFTFWKDWWVVRTSQWKLIQKGDERLLFRIDTDPDESNDLLTQEPAVTDRLVALRAAKLTTLETSAEKLEKASREAIDKMRALGYLQ